MRILFQGDSVTDCQRIYENPSDLGQGYVVYTVEAIKKSFPDMDIEFMELLDRVRELAGIPFYITCGYRSVQWDKSKGRSGNSAHCRGKAVDIHYKSSGDAYKIISSAIQLGIKRIGIGSNFIHLDNDNSLPQGVIWNYY